MRKSQLCKELGEKHSRQREQHVQRPLAKKELGIFNEMKEGHCGWSLRNKRDRDRGRETETTQCGT